MQQQTENRDHLLLFREFEPGDLISIAKLHRGGMRHVEIDVGDNCFEYYPDLLYPPAYLGSLKDPDKDGCLIVAEYVCQGKAQLVGMAGYKASRRMNEDSVREIRLTRISVDIRFGGLGIGSWLVKMVMALALTREANRNDYEKDILSYTPFVLSTTNRQAWNKFYGRLGFSEDSAQATSEETIQRTIELNEQLERLNRDPVIFINMRREVSKLALIQDLLIPLEALKRHPNIMVNLPIPVARWVESGKQVLPNDLKDGSLICDVNKLDPYTMVVIQPKVYRMSYQMFKQVYYDKILQQEQSNIWKMMRSLPLQAKKEEDFRYALSMEELQIINRWKKELKRLFDPAGPFRGNPSKVKIKDYIERLLKKTP